MYSLIVKKAHIIVSIEIIGSAGVVDFGDFLLLTPLGVEGQVRIEYGAYDEVYDMVGLFR